MTTAAAAARPNLKIAEIRIQDFRTIQDLWMPTRSSLVLLGENNSGKTAFLSALDVALGTARARNEDPPPPPTGGIPSRRSTHRRAGPDRLGTRGRGRRAGRPSQALAVRQGAGLVAWAVGRVRAGPG